MQKRAHMCLRPYSTKSSGVLRRARQSYVSWEFLHIVSETDFNLGRIVYICNEASNTNKEIRVTNVSCYYLNCFTRILQCTHYGDVITGAIAFQITSLTIVSSNVYSDADQRKHQSPASLAFVRGIHWGSVKSPHTWPVTRKMFPFDDVIMNFMNSCDSTWGLPSICDWIWNNETHTKPYPFTAISSYCTCEHRRRKNRAFPSCKSFCRLFSSIQNVGSWCQWQKRQITINLTFNVPCC